MIHEIKYPQETTYFICFNGTQVTAYGSVQPSQSMQSGQPVLQTFTSRNEWLKELQKHDINPDDTELNPDDTQLN